jgi:hypothetical protein
VQSIGSGGASPINFHVSVRSEDKGCKGAHLALEKHLWSYNGDYKKKTTFGIESFYYGQFSVFAS